MSESKDLVCPHCWRYSALSDETAIVRCPTDGFALVSPRALAKSEGDPLLGATLCDGFVPLELCANGSLSAIYRGRSPSHRDVAIKSTRLDGPPFDEAVDAWEREQTALSKASCPSLVRMIGAGRIESPRAIFIALEWLEGETLAARLLRGPIGIDLALRFAIDTAEALAVLHEIGLIHGDLKPSNAIVLPSNALKLVDLGASCVEGDRAHAMTPQYAAPEVFLEQPVDRRTDLYALGAVLHQMLIGEPPFVGTAEHIRRAHLETTPRRPSELNPEVPSLLDAILKGLLQKAPHERPSSAAALLHDLRSVAGAREPNRS